MNHSHANADHVLLAPRVLPDLIHHRYTGQWMPSFVTTRKSLHAALADAAMQQSSVCQLAIPDTLPGAAVQ